jgi:hypothetical protein
MSVSVEPTFTNCYVIKARDANKKAALVVDNSLIHYCFPMVKNDTREAHLKRLGSLTPVCEFPFVDSLQTTRFIVTVLEINNFGRHPTFQLPQKETLCLPARSVVEMLNDHRVVMFSKETQNIMKQVQKQLAALDQPTDYNWLLWKSESIPGKPMEKASEMECFCYNEMNTTTWWKLPCNHCFHRKCIEAWQTTCVLQEDKTFTCPMCRHVLG